MKKFQYQYNIYKGRFEFTIHFGYASTIENEVKQFSQLPSQHKH